MHPIRFLRRPDVRSDPLRLIGRRVYFETIKRIRPSLLRHKRVVRHPAGFRMALHLDDLIEQTIFLYGRHEFAASRLFGMLVRPGDVVVDAGAHVGQFALEAALLAGSKGRVMAFEPNELVRRKLETNVLLNGLANILVMDIALSDFEGSAVLVIPPGPNTGLSFVSPDGDAENGIRVKCASLDNILDRLGIDHVDLMKVDVEGAEAAVFEGARRVIAGGHPAILFEVGAVEVEASRARSVEVLRDLGYDLFGIVIHQGCPRLRPLKDVHDAGRFREPYSALNLVALHPGSTRGAELVIEARRPARDASEID